jgi:[protein-PII] uridylyltransferase
MTDRFEQLVALAQTNGSAFNTLSREECVGAVRDYAVERRRAIRERHDAGESGSNVLRLLSESADTLLRGVFDFALSSIPNRSALLSRVAACALGGYGRSELSPFSDLDVCLLYEGPLDDNLKALNSYLVPFLWDVGYVINFSTRSVSEAIALARMDFKVFMALLESRLISGDSTTFARVKLQLREPFREKDTSLAFIQSRARARYDLLSDEYKDLFKTQPNIKENRGGLRDFHTALWLFMMTYGSWSLDDVVSMSTITSDEHLDLIQALDFVWRIRNELHFHAGREDDVLTFQNQRHVAQAFGYGAPPYYDLQRFMQDYYAAAGKLFRFLHIAVQVCDRQVQVAGVESSLLPSRAQIIIRDGYLEAGEDDPHWFAEQPARLMEVFWECARHQVPLSRATERRIVQNLHLVTDTFRTSEIVRRYFIAICNRPTQAGFALRHAAAAGLLGAYLPEFAEIQGIIRYEDFHHFPVDEHTLRALEALAALPQADEPVSRCLWTSLEHLPDPYILVMAILFHDLGKAEGETHVEEGVLRTKAICRRIRMDEEDTERIAFLVRRHLLMTTISQYRDIDDVEIVESFAKTMKTEERLRTLFLLSYADMVAVAPGVWNEWKGALLLKLYLRTEKILLGRAETAEQEFWKSPKAQEVRDDVREELKPLVESHIQSLGDRYLLAFTPWHIARHLECVARAQESGLAMNCWTHEETGMSEVVVSTADRQGLFSIIAGSFASQLVDVNNAALFTRPDGWVVDCFTVSDATRERPITDKQFKAVEHTLRAALLGQEDIQEVVDQSRRRLFALLQPRVAARTQIAFDNDSSRTHTVIDIETGDRTGLLYDITQAIAAAGLDISTARIVTDARRVRDSFYVSLDKGKIWEKERQARIREVLHNAIHPRTLAEP